MPQSLSYVLVHLVFSAKDRRPWLDDTIRSEMHAYLASVLSGSENVCVRVGGVADHVHVALFLARTESMARVVERLKVASSKWVKTKGPEFARFDGSAGMRHFRLGWAIVRRWCGISMGRQCITNGSIFRRRCGRCL